MIQRLQSNISFKNTQLPQTQAVKEETKEAIAQEQPKQNFSITDTYQKAKKSITDVFKGFNNVTSVSNGAIRGIGEGIVATAFVGTIAKACKEENFHIIKTTGKILSDSGKGLLNSIKFIPSIITKSPLENIKTLGSLPKKFYKDYLKGHPAIATLATVGGLAVFALRTIQGKVNANQKNANLDHKTNQGHV